MSIEMVDFKYSNDITVVNRIQYDEHLKLYKGYVNKYNEIEELLLDANREEANSTYSNYRGLKRGESFALNGIILHELYFENIGGNTPLPEEMDGYLKHGFDNFDMWREDFVATAKASRGWAILSYEQRSRKLMNVSLDAHDHGNIALSYPILVLDMYEHAYFLDYGTEKGMYIDAFIENINWQVVKNRLEKLNLQ
ncbi:superoxide dismutase [Anaeromicropila herbilytica]|uniref:superoxide dismutase n=1 Tax=Anaeromicropila herbilytica TaxID=2785025 RepID=A0A7R7EK81_9FIRM|nr:Fe-Mn family superoxide dismutase [Anaeromicropila herbilytica]BCN30297.1 superoxide dismutase [Anaeromicropila herbilytica]